LCLYLNKQKRALDDYHWEYYDQQKPFLEKVLRPIFLCLDFQGTEKTQALVAQLATTKDELSTGITLHTMDRRPIQPRQKDYLVDEVGKVSPDRFEWLLYLQIPNKLNGQLYLPTVIKFRSLQDDLVNNERWKSKNKLIQQSMLPRLMEKPSRLIESLSNDLNNELARVSQRIEDGDNQNVILRNRTGKTQWRLPSTSVKSMLNNPFFDLLKPINIADVLRYVDQETNFLDHFEHVLPVQ
tara:strand:+ start:204 stop:923 length:720 start_codon:yes stop_codon:yes gene_type:complete